MDVLRGAGLHWRRCLILLTVCIAFNLTACGSREERDCPTPGAAEDGAGGEVGVDSSRSPEKMRQEWGAGPHAETDVKGESGYEPGCDRCHAPLSAWAIESTGGYSEAQSAQESASTAVGCPVCHPGEAGEESKEVAWLAARGDGEYEAVDGVDELCGHCHLADGVEGHRSIVVAGAHAGFRCTDCHDPHSSAASCTASGCHQPFAQECEPIRSHDRPHAAVSCSGCHATEELEIAWDPAQEKWHSYLSIRMDGAGILVTFTSHSLSLDVECERCHTPGDLPWIED